MIFQIWNYLPNNNFNLRYHKESWYLCISLIQTGNVTKDNHFFFVRRKIIFIFLWEERQLVYFDKIWNIILMQMCVYYINTNMCAYIRKIKSKKRWKLFIEPSSNIITNTMNNRRSFLLSFSKYSVVVLVPCTPNYS